VHRVVKNARVKSVIPSGAQTAGDITTAKQLTVVLCDVSATVPETTVPPGDR
jgi:hypothetical protein